MLSLCFLSFQLGCWLRAPRVYYQPDFWKSNIDHRLSKFNLNNRLSMIKLIDCWFLKTCRNCASWQWSFLTKCREGAMSTTSCLVSHLFAFTFLLRIKYQNLIWSSIIDKKSNIKIVKTLIIDNRYGSFLIGYRLKIDFDILW